MSEMPSELNRIASGRHVVEHFDEDNSLWLNGRCVRVVPTRGDVLDLLRMTGGA